MFIIAGPNGSGKSTSTRHLAKQGLDVIDPDRIARNLSSRSPQSVAVSAGKQAINQAKENINSGYSFAIETTLSSKSVYQRLIDSAKLNNFRVKLAYISTESPLINISRVADRVDNGGHDVPRDDIVRRYHRSLENLPNFFDKADEKIILDNSKAFSDNRLQLHIKDENTLFVSDEKQLAKWVEDALGKDRIAKAYENFSEQHHLNESEKLPLFQTQYQWSKEELKMVVTINDQQPNNIPSDTLSKIITTDKFLQNYSLETVQDGKLDLSLACGAQPVPKQYDGNGSEVQTLEAKKIITLS